MNLEKHHAKQKKPDTETTFHMILFTWNSRNKTIPTENKSLVARSHGWKRELAKEEMKWEPEAEQYPAS